MAKCDIEHASMTVGDFVKTEDRLSVVSLDGHVAAQLCIGFVFRFPALGGIFDCRCSSKLAQLRLLRCGPERST